MRRRWMRGGWGSQDRPEACLEKATQTPKSPMCCDILGLFCFVQCILRGLSAFWQLADAKMEFSYHALLVSSDI
jgi:hypothetical protein